VTGTELQRIARTILPPVGATEVVMTIVHEPGGKLLNGDPSGIGARTFYAPAWSIGGLRKSAPIARFDRQADALRLIAILHGEAPRQRARRPPAETRASTNADSDVTPSAGPEPSEAAAACSHPDWRIDYLNGPVGPVIGPLGAHRVLPVCTECGEPIPAFLVHTAAASSDPRADEQLPLSLAGG
jgi:hypothetical protein